MILLKKTHFYKYSLFLGLWVLLLKDILALSSRSTITYDKQAPFFTKEQQLSFQRLRPLLADDAKTKVVSLYDKFFQGSETLNVQDIKLLHNHFLIARNETIQYTVKQIIKEATLFDLIWKMLRQNSDLQDASSEEHTESERSSSLVHFARIRAHIGVGSFLEIGACEVSKNVATLAKNKTVIVIMQDEKETVQCSEKASSLGVNNMYVSKLSTEMLQQVIEDFSSDYKVLFGSILLKDFLTLSTSLLPHEFEQLLARVFSLSLQIFIPNMNINKSSKYYSVTETWSSPGELFKKACRFADLTCSVEMLWGFNRWSFSRAIYKVTVMKGFRLIHPDLCKTIGGYSQCYADFGTNSSRMAIRFENGNIYASPSDINEVPLKMFLKTGTVQPGSCGS
ncbi:uncharacterized protein LOC121374394 [Gigantopelta aegis]|uniref:uncharacterized protein LOC121374394 n=1 Tax=Gigantopelta aegis TaxID=1735272 RepID=UPI001B8879FA|nr:uncharacterized protein LOC121374394 [Gigantopelta aegis]